MTEKLISEIVDEFRSCQRVIGHNDLKPEQKAFYRGRMSAIKIAFYYADVYIEEVAMWG